MKDKNKTKEQFSELADIIHYNVESENFYQTAFENTGIATIIFKKDNIILLANGEFEKITGYTREEVEGKKKWQEFIARQDDLERMMEYHRLREVDPLSAPKTYEFQLVNRNGQVKDVFATVATIPGTKQTLMTLLDITFRKQMEADLLESQRRLADTINFLPDATFAIDLSGKVIAWNHAVEDMTGVKAADILGKDNFEHTMAFYGVRRPILVDLVFGLNEKIEKKYDFIEREGNVLLGEADVPVRGIHRALWGKAGPLYDSRGNIAGAIESVRDITERKQMEAALRESERRLADIIDFLPDATFAVDLSGKVIAWNLAMEEMTGVKAKDMLGKGNREYALPFYGLQRPVLIDLVFKSDEELEKNYAFVKREGDVLLTETRMAVGTPPLVLWAKASPLYNSSGNVIGAIESVRDITEIRQAREDLQKAHDKLELRVQERTEEVVRSQQTITHILESITDIYMAFDREWRFVELNAPAEKILGKARNEVLGKVFWELFPQMKESRYFRQYLTAMNSRTPAHFEAKLINGRWYESHAYPSDNSLSIYSRDITQRKEADEALQRSRTLLQSLIDNTPALIYAIDAEGRIIIANKAFGDLLGKNPSEIVGKRRHEFLPRDIAHRDDANDREVLSVGHSLEFEERGTFKEEETTFLTTKAPLHDRNGKIWGVTVISTDITERKRANEALKMKSADLIAVNKELESFAYSISHDLRAPLRAIDGFSRIILKKYGANFDDDVISKFNVIRDNAQIMGQLIDDILALSRLSSEKMSLVPLDMAGIINAVWSELRTINPERRMELIIKDVPSGFGDQTLLRQVYANLLGNAVKFTRKRDTALIEAGGYRKGKENIYYVKDNGAGFNMEYQNKLFCVFQRLHHVSEFEGTGIGLSIVSRIISRHGGRVWAEGKEDEGAVFYFAIPVGNQTSL